MSYLDMENVIMLSNNEPEKGTFGPWARMRIWLRDVIIPFLTLVIAVPSAILITLDFTFNDASVTNTIIYTVFGNSNDPQSNNSGGIVINDVEQRDDGDLDEPEETNDPDDILGDNEPSFLVDLEELIVEDFDEIGAYSDYQWYLESATCDTSPGESSLVFANEQSNQALDCNLALSADNLPWHQIGTIEAILRINSYNNAEMNHGIGLYTSDIEGLNDWYVNCGINAESDNIEAVFTGMTITNELPNSFFDNQLDNAAANIVNIDLETYYTFLLTIDYETNVISCYVDGMLIGELDADDIEGLTDAQIARSVSSYRSEGVAGETELDRVRILE